MVKRLRICLACLMILAFSPDAHCQFKWPGGAKAAICFTYDDALDCHLDYAVPQLDSAGLKGTFFCTGSSPSLYLRMEEWRKTAKNGHELGNHTLFHPCLRVKPDGTVEDWVKPEYDLAGYTLPQFISELKTANTLLKAIDGRETRSYGYTCGDCLAGGINFTDSLKSIFCGARRDGAIPETMAGYNTYSAPSWVADSPSAEAMISVVNKARENGTIAVFMFHSVGGGYLNVGAAEHRKLLEYIVKNKKDFYCATFCDVMNYIRNNKP